MTCRVARRRRGHLAALAGALRAHRSAALRSPRGLRSCACSPLHGFGTDALVPGRFLRLPALRPSVCPPRRWVVIHQLRCDVCRQRLHNRRLGLAARSLAQPATDVRLFRQDHPSWRCARSLALRQVVRDVRLARDCSPGHRASGAATASRARASDKVRASGQPRARLRNGRRCVVHNIHRRGLARACVAPSMRRMAPRPSRGRAIVRRCGPLLTGWVGHFSAVGMGVAPAADMMTTCRTGSRPASQRTLNSFIAIVVAGGNRPLHRGQ